MTSPTIRPEIPPSPTSPDYDIVICGAGMVGGAVACDLARAGSRVALLEKRLPPPFDKLSVPDIRVSSINPASEQYLTELGAWAHIRKMRCQPYQRLAVWEKLQGPINQLLPAGANQTTFDATSMGRTHLGHIVENQVIQIALQKIWSQQDNVHCFEGHSLQAIDVSNELVKLQLNNGKTLSTQLLIGADGAESKVRELAKLGVSSDSYHQHAMVSSVSTAGQPGDITWQSFTPHGPLAYLPLPAIDGITYASLVWYDDPVRLRELMTLKPPELIQRIQREFPAALPTIKHVIAKATFPLIKRHAQRYGKQRVVLVGDAAHTINPLAGQGLNLGLQDAKELAKQLGKAVANHEDPGDKRLLQAYENTRRPANQLMMNAMDAFYYTFSNNIPPVKLFRNFGLSLADKLTPAKKLVMSYALGLN